MQSLRWKFVNYFLFEMLSVEIDWSRVGEVPINFLTSGFVDAYVIQKFRLWHFMNSADAGDGISSVNRNARAEGSGFC